jgi:hypothetical protein
MLVSDSVSLNLHWSFCHLPDTNIISEGDDSEGYAKTIALIGRALLTGLHILGDHQLLTSYKPANGVIKNISLVLALFVEFARSWTDIGEDQNGETKWVSKAAQITEEHGIEIKGPYNFSECNKEILGLEEEEENDSASNAKPKEKKKKIHSSSGNGASWPSSMLIRMTIKKWSRTMEIIPWKVRGRL